MQQPLTDILELVAQHAAAATAEYRSAAARGVRVDLDEAQRGRHAVRRYDADDEEPQTYFHSSRLPMMTLASVYDALAQRIAACDDAAIGRMAVVLMLRYADRTGLPITAHMMHRLFFAAIVVAVKMHQDVMPRNRTFARAVSMPVDEANRLERALLEGIGWQAVVTGAQVEATAARLRVLSAAAAASAAASDAESADEGAAEGCVRRFAVAVASHDKAPLVSSVDSDYAPAAAVGRMPGAAGRA